MVEFSPSLRAEKEVVVMSPVFRRNLLIISRVLAFLLIAALFYWAYQYSQYAGNVVESPCWACGYYYGKKCDFQYYDEGLMKIYSKEAFLSFLGEYNRNMSSYMKDTGKMRDYNLTMLSNIS